MKSSESPIFQTKTKFAKIFEYHNTPFHYFQYPIQNNKITAIVAGNDFELIIEKDNSKIKLLYIILYNIDFDSECWSFVDGYVLFLLFFMKPSWLSHDAYLIDEIPFNNTPEIAPAELPINSKTEGQIYIIIPKMSDNNHKGNFCFQSKLNEFSSSNLFSSFW